MDNITQSNILSKLEFLISSHLSLLEGVSILLEKALNKKEKNMLRQWIEYIENGKSLSFCINNSNLCWSNFVPHIIAAGEMTGTLAESIGYAAKELKKHHELKQKIIGIMIYPLCIAVATVGVTGMIFFYILPKIMPLFESLEVNLPISTTILLFIYHFLGSYGLYLIVFLFLFILFFVLLLKKKEKIRICVEGCVARIPILGFIFKFYEIARTFRLISVLLKNDISFELVFLYLQQSSSHLVYRDLYKKCYNAAIQGKRVSEILSNSYFVPDLVSSMCAVGESTGSMSETSFYIAEYYERELDVIIKKLSSLIEPILMIVLGVVVGFVAISVISPIYEITQHIKK